MHPLGRPQPTSGLLLLAACALAGCGGGRRAPSILDLSPFGDAPAGENINSGASGWEAASYQDDGPLYGWDGSPVGEAGPQAAPPELTPQDRALEKSGGSRLVLLELYNQAVEERDGYQLEVEEQNRALEEMRTRHDDLERRFEELSAAFDALEQSKTLLAKENEELAARLATAQIRRLETEKAWLESTLEWEQRLEESTGKTPEGDGQ